MQRREQQTNQDENKQENRQNEQRREVKNASHDSKLYKESNILYSLYPNDDKSYCPIHQNNRTRKTFISRRPSLPSSCKKEWKVFGDHPI